MHIHPFRQFYSLRNHCLILVPENGEFFLQKGW